jgi:hypothetical protein
MVQVASGTPGTATFDGNSGSTGSFAVAAGEQLLVFISLEVTDAAKEVLSVVWDVASPESLTLFDAFSPGHGKQRAEVWYHAAPSPATDTITVTIEGGNSQKTGISAFPISGGDVANLGGWAEVGNTENGSTLSLAAAQAANDLGFGFYQKLTNSGGITWHASETELTDLTVAGSYKHSVAEEDAVDATQFGQVNGTGGNKESCLVVFYVPEAVDQPLVVPRRKLTTVRM